MLKPCRRIELIFARNDLLGTPLTHLPACYHLATRTWFLNFNCFSVVEKLRTSPILLTSWSLIGSALCRVAVGCHLWAAQERDQLFIHSAAHPVQPIGYATQRLTGVTAIQSHAHITWSPQHYWLPLYLIQGSHTSCAKPELNNHLVRRLWDLPSGCFFPSTTENKQSLCGVVFSYASDDLQHFQTDMRFVSIKLRRCRSWSFRNSFTFGCCFPRNLCLRAGNSALHTSCSCGSLTVMNRRGVNSCDDNCKIEREDMIISKVCLERLLLFTPRHLWMRTCKFFFDNIKWLKQ